MKKVAYLDAEEREIDKAINSGTIVSLGVKSKEKKRLQKIAKNTLTKSKSISIRLSERDLVKIKARAMREGLPYQTFIASLIHKESEKV